MASSTLSKKQRRPRLVAALMVGATLAAFGAMPADAAARQVTDVSRYCTACWRNARIQPDAWSDCTHEVLLRLLERVEPTNWPNLLAPDTEARKEFIRAIDTVKKRTQRAQRHGPLENDVPDYRESFDQDRHEQRRLVTERAERVLPDRQAEIIRRSLDGWSVADIARDLRISAARVSDEKYKAVQRLRQDLSRDQET